MFEFSIMRKILSKILLLLVLPISVLSQENDFQTWTSISASKKIIKKTNLIVKQGARFRENSSLYSKIFTDLKIKSKSIKKEIIEPSIQPYNDFKYKEIYGQNPEKVDDMSIY